jgi:hypothetical protein
MRCGSAADMRAMAWHWDAEKGRRMQSRSRSSAWAGGREPFRVGLAIGTVAAVALLMAGASVVAAGFLALVIAGSAASLVSLLAEPPTAAELAAPNPAELQPDDAARAASADEVADALRDLADQILPS